MKYLALFEIIGCLGITAALLVLSLTGQVTQPMSYLRYLIIIPFGLWWGFSTLKKEKQKEFSLKTQNIKNVNENNR